MPNLWVDVDETLIFYPDDAPNTTLIKKLEEVSADYGGIVVWSGGGAAYAHRWADKLLKDVDVMACFGKNFESFKLIKPGDICIDDMDLEFPKDLGVTVMTWQEFCNAG